MSLCQKLWDTAIADVLAVILGGAGQVLTLRQVNRPPADQHTSIKIDLADHENIFGRAMMPQGRRIPTELSLHVRG